MRPQRRWQRSVVIAVDMRQALSDGFSFYLTAAGAIITPEPIPAIYVHLVYNHKKARIWYVRHFWAKLPSVPDRMDDNHVAVHWSHDVVDILNADGEFDHGYGLNNELAPDQSGGRSLRFAKDTAEKRH